MSVSHRGHGSTILALYLIGTAATALSLISMSVRLSVLVATVRLVFYKSFGWTMCHTGNSRVQITTWAGGYSRREWSGMVSNYYGERTKIWLNNTLHQLALASVEHGVNGITTASTGADVVRSA